MRYRTYLLGLIIVSLSGLIAGCGSSGDSSTVQTTTIAGSVIAGRVEGANVTVKDPGGAVIAGPVTTTTEGTFSINIPDSSLPGDIVIESDSGQFTDEATGDSQVLAGKLSAFVTGGTLSAGSEVHITPASTILRNLVAGGKTKTEAETNFSHAFGFVSDLSVRPDDATNPSTDASETNKRLAGLRAAAFSQLTKELGLTPQEQFNLLTALAQDLSDGILDGEDTTGHVDIAPGSHLPEDIQNRFERALMNFRTGGKDKTGLTPDKIGLLPFGKVALTATYRVEYIEGMMAAMEGKTQFKLKISDRTTGNPVTGLTMMLMPMMNMATMSHGTAVDGCAAGASPGDYNCTIYYLMASSMANGMSMGYWELKVTAGAGMTGESAYLYPNVAMAMGDTARAVLKGQTTDQIAGMGMGMTTARSYYLFKDGISGTTGDHTFKLFIAARESMMSHPAVSVGTVLNVGTMYELTVASMSVDVSSDGSAWFPATDNGSGHWSASAIPGLTDDVKGTLYVRLTVNGEQKTTNGSAPAGDGSNDYGTFTITP